VCIKGSTHDEVDVDGWLVLLTALADTRELPLGLLLYSSDSDNESVCESSASELEVEYDEDCNP
jgi:hypothetical protein